MSNDYRNSEGYPDPTAGEALSRIVANEKQSLRAFRPIVYICSPFSGDVETNVANARRYSRFAVDKRYIPIAPHLLFPQFLDDDNPDECELGLFFGNALMSKCAEVWVFGNPVWKQKSNAPSGKVITFAISQKNVRRFNAMYEIKENRRELFDGTEITTYTRNVVSANILQVEAGTTGYKGGDTGHGGRTYFRISDEASTDIHVTPFMDRFGCNGFEVALGGDCELETMIRALKFITKVLEEESEEVYD